MTAIRAARRLDHFQPTVAKPIGDPVGAAATSSMPSASGAAISARAIAARPSSEGEARRSRSSRASAVAAPPGRPRWRSRSPSPAVCKRRSPRAPAPPAQVGCRRGRWQRRWWVQVPSAPGSDPARIPAAAVVAAAVLLAGAGRLRRGAQLHAAPPPDLPRRLRHHQQQGLPPLQEAGRSSPGGARGLLPLGHAADLGGAPALAPDQDPGRAQPLHRSRRAARDDQHAPDRQGPRRPLHPAAQPDDRASRSRSSTSACSRR